MKVAIIFGSETDKDSMKPAAKVLEDFGIAYKAFVISAHRAPEFLAKTIREIEDQCTCIIAGAGLAAHLPGVIASQTVLPVIGVPLNGALDGIDSLYSIVQMPKNIPVATVGIENSYNAGMLAVEICALADAKLKEKLKQFRKKLQDDIIKENEKGDVL